MTWPTLPAPAAACFFDHFDTLDAARWGSVVSGSGAISVADSYVQLSMAANSACAIYHQTPLDVTKSQLWLACVSFSALNTGGFAPRIGALVTRASAPVGDTKPNIDLETVIDRYWTDTAHIGLGYVSNTGSSFRWSGAAGASPNSWVNAGTAANSQADVVARVDDYYVVGFEIDAAGNRWREMVWAQTFATAGTYTFNQGYRLYSLSDWVSFTATKDVSAGLWFTLGWLANNNTVANTMRVEWVRYSEAVNGTDVIDAWLAAGRNQSSDLGVSEHQIRHYSSLDGVAFLPDDRTSVALAYGPVGAFDHVNLQEPWAVYDGAATDYLFYSGNDYTGHTPGIGVASAAHAIPQTGPWTKSPSNPLIVPGASGSDDDNMVGFAWVVCDESEPDPNKRWKMLYAGQKVADSKWRTLYATAPAAAGPWTKQGTVLDVGAAGAGDEAAARDVCVVRTGSGWVVFYEGWTAAKVGSVMWATGTDLGALTKQGTLFTMPRSAAAGDQVLTANLTAAPGRTVNVADTSGFDVDAEVVFSQETFGDDYAVSRIRKILSPTQLELYHGLTGFTTTYPARVKQIDSEVNITPRQIVQRGSEWWFYLGVWEPFAGSAESASYGQVLEETWIATHSNPDPTAAVPTIDHLASPVAPRGFNSDQRTVENMTLLNAPFAATTFDDAGEGAVVLAGAGAEASTRDDTGAGAIAAAGAASEEAVFDDAGQGALELAGAGAEASVFDDAGDGTLTLTGGSVSQAVHGSVTATDLARYTATAGDTAG